MERLHVAVCDDDRAALGIISSSLKDIFASKDVEAQVELFDSALKLQEVLPIRRFDLMLLDIDMPELDGITFARHLRESRENVDIMYISSREDKVFDSLRVDPVGFIRKSRFLEEMGEIVGAYIDKRRARTEAGGILLHRAGLIRPLRATEIAYVEGSRKNQIIHLVNGESVTLRSSMYEIEEDLDAAGFIRVHQGYLVNWRQIKLIEEHEIELASGERIPVSRRKVVEVRNRYLDLVSADGGLVF